MHTLRGWTKVDTTGVLVTLLSLGVVVGFGVWLTVYGER